MTDEHEQLLEMVKNLMYLRKMCEAIVKYNELRDEKNDQFLIRHDVFIRIKRKLEEMS